MQIDKRFLSAHPATMLWWQQREQCESCRHLALREGNDGEAVMRCMVVEHKDANLRRMLSTRRVDVRVYCIDARAEGGDCGPEAKLWLARE